jgi:ABC-type glutathione transport system ATPase component
MRAGETLGLVGGSGSGKSTLARCILQLVKPTSGSVTFGSTELTALSGAGLRRERARIGMIFQDPYASLNTRWHVEKIIRHPLEVHHVGTRAERRASARRVLDQVGLPSSYRNRIPSQLSGGERQRVAIGRALALEPRVILCDEPTSALDVSVQAQILNLLQEIQHDRHVALLFISHDMAVVRRISQRIAIMHAGELVEVGDVDRVFEHPEHDYTRRLISAVPALPGRSPRR